MDALRGWISLARPAHWSKNAFVLMPVPFAVADGAPLPLMRIGVGLLAFSLASSAVYAFNDAQDAQRDRLHKTKRYRPVAAERISVGAARAFGALLAAAALSLAGLALGARASAVLASYLLLNAIYSTGAKNVPLLDVFILSSGFVLRVLLGCALIAAVPSNWLLVCSSSLALFLSLAKRRADVVAGVPAAHRPAVEGYTVPFLDQALMVTASTTVVSYALYSIDARVLIAGRELSAMPFVLFGVLDYLRRVTVHGEGGDPVETVTSSRALILCALGWAAATLWSVRIS